MKEESSFCTSVILLKNLFIPDHILKEFHTWVTKQLKSLIWICNDVVLLLSLLLAQIGTPFDTFLVGVTLCHGSFGKASKERGGVIKHLQPQNLQILVHLTPEQNTGEYSGCMRAQIRCMCNYYTMTCWTVSKSLVLQASRLTWRLPWLKISLFLTYV